MGTRRMRRSAEEWRTIVARQAESGRTVEGFCQEEGLSRSVFNRWRVRLARGTSTASPRRARPKPFLELGEFSSTSAPTVRLELGGGIVLTISR
jgi:putative transposase